MGETKTGLPFSSVLIIGVGLIGGSLGAALKALDGEKPLVRGVDIDARVIETALAKGYLDEGAVLGKDDELIGAWLEADKQSDKPDEKPGDKSGDKSDDKSGDKSDDKSDDKPDDKTNLVILAVPVSGARDWLTRIENSGYSGAITDVASTKGVVTDLAQEILSQPSRYIPGHPMAGSEVNGIEGARAALFQNAHWILCPDEESDPDIFSQLYEFVTSIGARGISLPREEHDETIAVVSHVPHMIASALVCLAGSHAQDRQEIFRLAAGGFKDTTRIAAGSPELWCGIALDNHKALAQGLAEIKEIITAMQMSIEDGNAQELTRLLLEAAQLRSSIPAAWVPDSARLVEVRIPMANHSGVIAQVTGFAAKAACNIQSINIDHINEATAILELILTDEGDKGRFMSMLIDGGFDVSFRPLGYNVS